LSHPWKIIAEYFQKRLFILIPYKIILIV
jgi:hypothetical protein